MKYTWTGQDVGPDLYDSDADAAGLTAPFQVGAIWKVLPVVKAAAKKTQELVFTNTDGDVIDSQGNILDNNGNVKSSNVGVKVAKWQDAFDLDPASKTKGLQIKLPDRNNHDFIDREVDRFTLRLRNVDVRDWLIQDVVYVNIWTKNVVGFTDYNDDKTVVALIRNPNVVGEYMSDTQIMVSNMKDDEHTDVTRARIGTDNTAGGARTIEKDGMKFALSDRTHIVALRGNVYAKLVEGNLSAVVPVIAKKKVDVRVTILKDKAGNGGVAVTTEAAANGDIMKANEALAQVGIYFVPTFQIKDPPFQLTGTITVHQEERDPQTGEVIQLASNKIKQIVDLRKDPNANPQFRDDQIDVFYVDQFNRDLDPRGYALVARINDADYRDAVVISDKALQPGAVFGQPVRNPFVVAHELTHVLTNFGHIDITSAGKQIPVVTPSMAINLMVTKVSNEDLVGATKRLNVIQQIRILGTFPGAPARPNLLKAPDAQYSE